MGTLGKVEMFAGGSDNDPKKTAIQLSTPGTDEYDHYLPMFRFVNYKENVNSLTEKKRAMGI